MTARAKYGMDLIFWVFAVAAVAIVGGAVIIRFRRRFLATRQSMAGTGWRPEDLEAMRRSGQVTEQEFKALWQQVLEVTARSAKDSGSSGSTSPAETNDNSVT